MPYSLPGSQYERNMCYHLLCLKLSKVSDFPLPSVPGRTGCSINGRLHSATIARNWDTHAALKSVQTLAYIIVHPLTSVWPTKRKANSQYQEDLQSDVYRVSILCLFQQLQYRRLKSSCLQFTANITTKTSMCLLFVIYKIWLTV